MSVPITFPFPVELPDPPTSPDTLIVSVIAKRARVSRIHAAVIASLAGLGPREARLG